MNWLRFTGPDGPQGLQGLPGEVSAQQLSDAVATTANNPISVDLLNLTISDPPTQSEVESVKSKLNELIAALRR